MPVFSGIYRCESVADDSILMVINILGYMRNFSRFMQMSVLPVLAMLGLVSCGKDNGAVISADLKLVPDKTCPGQDGDRAERF